GSASEPEAASPSTRSHARPYFSPANPARDGAPVLAPRSTSAYSAAHARPAANPAGAPSPDRPMAHDPFRATATLQVGGRTFTYSRLGALQDQGVADLARLPYSIRVLLEAALRTLDGFLVEEKDVRAIAGLRPRGPPEVEIPFLPGRVVLQDFTGVPCVVDLAAMRAAMRRLGGDPKKINPLVP